MKQFAEKWNFKIELYFTLKSNGLAEKGVGIVKALFTLGNSQATNSELTLDYR